MFTPTLLHALLAKLAEDFPDTAKTYSPEVFADWLVGYHKQLNKPVNYADFLEFGQPLVPFTDTEIEVVKARAKELLQQYRGTFPTMGAPWEASLRNFPCVAVDLASGVDYSVERKTGFDPVLAAPYGSKVRGEHSCQADIYKSLVESMNKVRTPAEQLIQHRLTQTWTIRDGKTVISYSPHNAVDIPVLLMTELLDNGVVEVVESWEGDAAVKQARYYLECFEARMKR